MMEITTRCPLRYVRETFIRETEDFDCFSFEIWLAKKVEVILQFQSLFRQFFGISFC